MLSKRLVICANIKLCKNYLWICLLWILSFKTIHGIEVRLDNVSGGDLNETNSVADLLKQLFSSENYTPDLAYNRYPQQCLTDDECHELGSVCNPKTNVCVCDTYYYYEDNRCVRCPTENAKCTSCCSGRYLECVDGYCQICYDFDGNFFCDDNKDTVIFMTASQIALSAALIMGILALVTLLYRICVRPNYLTFRSSNVQATQTLAEDVNGLSGNRNNFSRASLTSIQIRVLARLRNRPPRYETQHNYESRRRQQQRTDSQENSNVVQLPIEAPPSYDGSVTANRELPPSYEETLNQTGIDNNGFLNTEPNHNLNVICRTINETNEIKDIVDQDKAIHI